MENQFERIKTFKTPDNEFDISNNDIPIQIAFG